jgi:hypothetical protein
MTGRGYTVVSESSRSVTFARRQAADMGITCALMVLFIVPGLLYYSFAKGKQANTTIVAVPEGGKTRLSYSSDDWIARWPVRQFFDEIAPAPGEKDFRKLGRDPDVSHLSINREKSRPSSRNPNDWNTGSR